MFDLPSPLCRVLIRSFPVPSSNRFRKVRDYSVCVQDDGSCYFSWKNELSARVKNGREIWLDPAPDLDPRVLELLVQGPLYAMLLKQKGFVVLHASAVSLRGRATAFLGFSGQGKSTLAAAMHFRKKHAFVTDNAMALFWDHGKNLRVLPSQPFFKLSGRSSAALGLDTALCAPIEPGSHKKKVPAHKKTTASARLSRIYVLKEGSRSRIEAVSPATAFTDLVRHSYFPADAFPADSGRNFLLLSRLASEVPPQRITVPHRWDLLDGVISLIERGK